MNSINKENNFKSWFGKSKMVDSNNRPIRFYHGTPSATFSEFKSDNAGLIYFTTEPSVSEAYLVASGSATPDAKKHQRPSSPGMYAVYLRIETPFDTRKAQHRKLFMNSFYMKWGTGTELDPKLGLPDWNDADDLREWIDDNDYPFDGLLLAEAHGTITYAVFDPNQIKSIFNNGNYSRSSNNITESISD